MSEEERIKKYLDKVYAVKNCMRCGKSFKEHDERAEGFEGIICGECFHPSLVEGCDKINKFLAKNTSVKKAEVSKS